MMEALRELAIGIAVLVAIASIWGIGYTMGAEAVKKEWEYRDWEARLHGRKGP